jgi:N-glycosylase/DNA lyase
MSNSDGGKGSSPRPFSISEEEYARRWDAIFGREDVEKIVDDAKKYLEESKRTEKSIQGLEQRLKDSQND